MNHYVYRITNIKLNKHYYGVRSTKINPSDDIGFHYFSSSTDTDFLYEQRENPTNFKYKVIKTFNTRKDANAFEVKIHNKFDVAANESFYNLAKATSSGFTRSGLKPWNAGKKGIYSEETLKKISESSTGRKFSKETKELLSKQRVNNTYKLGVKESSMTKRKKSQRSKENNSRALHINIYDNDDKLLFECYSNFKTTCDKHCLPYKQLTKSYKTGERVLESLNGLSPDYIQKYKKFKGYYAVVK